MLESHFITTAVIIHLTAAVQVLCTSHTSHIHHVYTIVALQHTHLRSFLEDQS